jgi:ubiquitin carboxyl-terminal hydrolase 7
MHDVAQDFLRKEVKLHATGTGQIRIFDLAHGRSQRFFQGNEVVRDIAESTELYAEEVLIEEEESRDNERVIQVYHFNKDPTRAHGVPFKFILRQVSNLSRVLCAETLF